MSAGHLNCSEEHFGDALAVDMLLNALFNQPQLESIDIRLQNEGMGDDIHADHDDEPEYFVETDVEDQTERLYQPVWESLYVLLEHSMGRKLRCNVMHIDKDVASSFFTQLLCGQPCSCGQPVPLECPFQPAGHMTWHGNASTDGTTCLTMRHIPVCMHLCFTVLCYPGAPSIINLRYGCHCLLTKSPKLAA